MLVHGVAPEGLTKIMLHPIPKDRRSSSRNSDNYRGIALSSIIGKLFDWAILIENEERLCTSDLQFGFKPDTSTTQCTGVLLECVNYYTSRDTNVNLLFLDATKAFDRVEYVKLFKLLVRRGISPIVIRLLLNMYTRQKVSVVWNNTITEPFECKNGVKQGGVLSPILFGIYIDEMLIKLKNSGLGCHIGHVFMGALAYADDLVLMAPTMYGLKKLLEISHDFAKEYNIIFNPKKSKWMSYALNDSGASVYLDGKPVDHVDHFVHLGCLIGPNSFRKSLERHINKFYSEVNLLMAQFGKAFASSRHKLFKSYCMSCYGSQLWDFSSNEVDKFFVAWRKAIRFLWKLPRKTHCSLLPLISCDPPIEFQLHRRFFKYIHKVINSDNSVVKMYGKLILEGSRSSTGKSFNFLLRKYGVNRDSLLDCECTALAVIKPITHSPEIVASATTVRELCEIRDQRFTGILQPEEVVELINAICIG